MRRQKYEPKFAHLPLLVSTKTQWRARAVSINRWPVNQLILPRGSHSGLWKSIKTFVSYKLTSGPVVLRRVTAAQQRSGGSTVTQTILIGWCVREHHHHQTTPLFLSPCFLTHSLTLTPHKHTHQTRVPRTALCHRLKLSISPRSSKGRRPQLGFTNKPPFPGVVPSRSATLPPPPPGLASPPGAAPRRLRPRCVTSSWWCFPGWAAWWNVHC